MQSDVVAKLRLQAKIENTSIIKLKLDWKMPKSKGGHHPVHLEVFLAWA